MARPGQLMGLLWFFPPLSLSLVLRLMGKRVRVGEGRGGQSAFSRVLCQTSNEAGEGFPSTLTRPSPPQPLVSCLRVVSPRPIRRANKTNEWTKGCKVAVATAADWYAAECVSEVCREVEPQTDTLPPTHCCCCCFSVFFLLLLPVNMQRNWLLTFYGIVWGM